MQTLIIGLLGLTLACGISSAAVKPVDKPGMAVTVQPGEYTVRGQKVKVARAYTLPIDKPEEITVSNEQQVIKDEKTAAFWMGTVLEKTTVPIDLGIRLPNAIVPESVKVHSRENGGTVYAEGKDYTLDHVWGGLSRIETGAIPKDAKACIDYKVTLQRIDTVQVSRSGAVSVKKGKSVQVLAEAPAPDAGCTTLANIYIPYRCTAITAENILPAPEKDITWRKFIKVSGREHLQNTLRLLKEKKPVSIVCWGDSVTVGCSAQPLSDGYVERFRKALVAAYPGAQINVTNAGIGGTHTDVRLKDFDKEVLSYNPDLITIEFVNDCGLPAEKVTANWNKFIAQAREKNPKVEFIIITPHMTMPNLMSGYDKAVKAMRKTAKENKTAIADTTNIWVNLSKVQIPYETLLANGINHPNNLGHDFFAISLMELLKPADDDD